LVIAVGSNRIPPTQNFAEIRRIVASGQTADMLKLIVALSNFAKAPAK